MIDKIKSMDKKLLIYLGIGIGSIFLILILLLILKISVGSSITSKQFESRLKDSAKKYCKNEKNKLPEKNGDKISITIDELVDEGYIKDPEKLLKKDVTCQGQVNVSNNNGYYIYQPVIKCSDGYKTDLLANKIIKDNPVKTSGDGLYKVNNGYLFRGEFLNNYVKFIGKTWRIVRINKDKSIRIIMEDSIDSVPWDNRYNIDHNDSIGKNDFEVSRIKQTLNDYFNNKRGKLFKKEDKALIVPTELCIGGRNVNSLAMDGYIECSKKSTERLPIGLLQVNEYPIVSLDPNCTSLDAKSCKNYNYLAKLGTYWTITPDPTTTYNVYRIDNRIESIYTNAYSQPKFVVNITGDVLYHKGDGTIKKPYIIK